MHIPLEDNVEDIIGKAQKGLGISDSQLAEKIGAEIGLIRKLREGEFSEKLISKVAPVLNLNAAALVSAAKKDWYPGEINGLEGFAWFNTPFGDMTVNSYLVWDSSSREAVAFDTGADCTEMLKTLEKHNLKLKYILLTHTHGDHIFDLDRLISKTGAKAFVCDLEPIDGAERFEPGKTFEAGGLKIQTLLTSGHSVGGITYVINGLNKPVAVVGDSLFAGSMGGGMVSYEDAVRNNLEKILILPEDTVLCSGHGPLTTVGEEKKHNPFFAGKL